MTTRTTLENTNQKFTAKLAQFVSDQEILRLQRQKMTALYESSFVVRRVMPQSDLKGNHFSTQYFNTLFGHSIVRLTQDFYILERLANELYPSASSAPVSRSQFERLSFDEKDDPKLFFPPNAVIRNLSFMMEEEMDPQKDQHVDIDTAKEIIERWKRCYNLFIEAFPLSASYNLEEDLQAKDLFNQAISCINSIFTEVDVGYVYAKMKAEDQKVWLEKYQSMANFENRAKNAAYWTKAQALSLSYFQRVLAVSTVVFTLAALTWQSTRESED